MGNLSKQKEPRFVAARAVVRPLTGSRQIARTLDSASCNVLTVAASSISLPQRFPTFLAQGLTFYVWQPVRAPQRPEDGSY